MSFTHSKGLHKCEGPLLLPPGKMPPGHSAKKLSTRFLKEPPQGMQIFSMFCNYQKQLLQAESELLLVHVCLSKEILVTADVEQTPLKHEGV